MPICKQCLCDKFEIEFYKHPQTKDWIMHRCKKCILDWRKTDHEKELARQYNKKRYYSNPSRRLDSTRQQMNMRCYDKKNSHFKRYGWRWIQVTRKNKMEFKKDMLESYIEHRNKYPWRQTQIDRINNDWNYCKENCHRVTAKENNFRNKNIF